MKIRENTVIYLLLEIQTLIFNRFYFILRKLNIYLYVVHVAAPDESHAHLHQEYASETQVQGEKGTISSNARLSSK